MKRGPVIALLIAVVAVVWILSGQIGGDQVASEQSTDATGVSTEAAIPSVRVTNSVAQPKIQQISLFGRTEAERSVDIRAETDGSIEVLDVAEGDLIEGDATIVRLALNGKDARLKDAEGQLHYRKVAYEAAEELSKKQYRSEVKLAEEKAELSSAYAALAIARVELARTNIKAPFGGVIGELYVEHGKSVRVGDAIVRIDDLDPIIVSAQITEREINHVTLGQRAQVRLASGQEYSGAIGYIAQTANTETRTFRIEINIANRSVEISAGLTAEVLLFTKPVSSHLISPAVLTLNDQGKIGVKGVGGDNVAKFYAVQIVAETTNGIWITGLPDSIRVITVGQEFVIHGQAVNPVDSGT
jgi:membrane fusion protein, multidrug efflux system